MFDVEEHGALSSCTLVCVFAAVDGSRRITPSSLQRQRPCPGSGRELGAGLMWEPNLYIGFIVSISNNFLKVSEAKIYTLMFASPSSIVTPPKILSS